MPNANLPTVELSGNVEKDVVTLADTVAILRKELNYLLYNLDEKNVVRAGSVYAENIDTTNAKIQTAQIESLEVGDNVTLGPNAYIAWSNVTDADSNALQSWTNSDYATYINSTGVYTGTLYANQIEVGADKGYISFTQFESTPTASDVGARPDDWVPTQNELGQWTTYIDSTGVYTGTVTAQNINGEYISTQNWDGTGDYLTMNRQNIYFYEDGTPNDIVKMAVGFLPNKDNVNTPLIVLGAGDGYGNNRGYIQKDTDGLSMYYVGSLGGDEVSYLKLTKDKASLNGYDIFSKKDSISDSYISSASNWNTTINKTAKLNSSGTNFSGKVTRDVVNPKDYIEVGGGFCDFRIFDTGFSSTYPWFAIRQEDFDANYGSFSLYGANGIVYPFMYFDVLNDEVRVRPRGEWNFSNANVTGLTSVAVFG